MDTPATSVPESRRGAGTFSIWTPKDQLRQAIRNDQPLSIPEIMVLLARNSKGTWEQFFKNEVYHIALGVGTLLELLERGHITFDVQKKSLEVGQHPKTPLPEYLEKDLFYMSSFITDTPPLTVETWLLGCVPFIRNVPTIPSGPKRFEMILDHLVELKVLELKKAKGYHYDLLNASPMQEFVRQLTEMVMSDTDKPSPVTCTMMTLFGQIHRGLGFGKQTLLENLFEKEVFKQEKTKISKYAEPKKWLPLVQGTDPLVYVRVEIFNSLKKILTPYGSQQQATLRQQSETKEQVRQSIQDKGIAPPAKTTIKRVMDIKTASVDSITSLGSSTGSDHFAAWLKEHLSLPEAFCLFSRSDKTGDWRQVQQQEIFHFALSALSLHELLSRGRLSYNSTTGIYAVNTMIMDPPQLPFYLDQDLQLANEICLDEPEAFTLEYWINLPQSKDEKRLENVVTALSRKEILEMKRGTPSQNHYAASVLSTVELKQFVDESTKAILACTRTPPALPIALLLTVAACIPKDKGVSKKISTRFVEDEVHQVFRLRVNDRPDELFLGYCTPDEVLFPSALKICQYFQAQSKNRK